MLGNVARYPIQYDGDLKVLCLNETGLKMVSFGISDELICIIRAPIDKF